MGPKKIISGLICLIFIVSFFACAETTTKKRVVVTKRKPLYEQSQQQARPDQIEKTGSPAYPLLAEGIEQLQNNKVNEAEWKFEEAINLDPDFGQAYYWLARARYRLNEVKDALNLLEKAEALLKKSSVWMGRISEFKEFLADKTN